MNPTTLRFLGTLLEIVGTFFLAAEAIKLHNLRALRERHLEVLVVRTNPIIRSLKAKAEGVELPWAYFGILILLGAVLVYTLLAFRAISIPDVWRAFRSFVPGAAWVNIVAAVPVALVLLFTLSLFGSFLVQVLSTPLLLAIVLLEFVEKRSASGLVGVLGFVFFLAGAIMKAFLDWVRA